MLKVGRFATAISASQSSVFGVTISETEQAKVSYSIQRLQSKFLN